MVFGYTDYKKWVNDRISAMPNGGRGQYSRIVEHIGSSSAIVTQIFKGSRELTPEQAILLCDYFGFSKLERQYFLLLVNYSRAASFRYKKILKEEIREFQLRAKEIGARVPQDRELSEEAKATLYSNWYYLAIWSLTAIPGLNSIDLITERLSISRAKANQALAFLIKHSLVLETAEGLTTGPTLLHLESSSPNIPRHHQNWRNRALLKYEELGEEDAAYTAPITLSLKDAALVRERVLNFIAETVAFVEPSPSEELFCLCLDWFKV